ncbi:MalY/PatB family protein [Bogoriella caseilytica]|uniref:cysteine-S-conjugate beta-lyase n=1 Tax=Bogoriella caseilytica TaxID=56055 RepID=A0A3N2BDQ6_9MICO|nr:aminotransferase class I/II-fold pyridoxal phosphate-dependent enzyme [Bogoriella caseilytica]ROR73388.1 cystathionine beta-lyase [Bogoriella caseilytica]
MTETSHQDLHAQFDAITPERLRDVGSVKWSTFPGAVGAFVAEMDYGTAPEVTAALHETIERGLFGYLPDAVAQRMSEASARWHADAYGWQVDPARIRPLSDVLTGLDAVIEHYSEPGSPVILPTPAYMPFLKRPVIKGREIIEVPMVLDGAGQGRSGRYVYDLDALDAAFARGGHLLILCNPHNPVGRVLEREELLAISEVVERHGGRVFSDEIHAPLVFEGYRHVPYASISETAAGHTVTATSASKAWNLPGLKCAQLVLSNDADVATWRKVGQVYESVASTPGAVAAAAALDHGRDWLAGVIAYLDGNRRLLAELAAEHLPGAVVYVPEGTYLSLIDFRPVTGDDGAPLLGDHPAQHFLKQAQVAMTDGALCGQAARGTARFNLGMPRPVLRRAVEAMRAALPREVAQRP